MTNKNMNAKNQEAARFDAFEIRQASVYDPNPNPNPNTNAFLSPHTQTHQANPNPTPPTHTHLGCTRCKLNGSC